MFSAFIMSTALAGPPPSPHSLVRAKPGPCQAQRRPLAKNSRAVLRKAGGLSRRPAGTQVSASCPRAEEEGQDDLRAATLSGTQHPPSRLAWEPPSKKSQGHLTLGPLAPSVNLASQPGDPLLQPRLSADPRLDPAPNLGSPLLCVSWGWDLPGGRGQRRWEPQGRWSLLLGSLLCSGGRQHGMEIPATAAGSWCGADSGLRPGAGAVLGCSHVPSEGWGYPVYSGAGPRVPAASVHLAALTTLSIPNPSFRTSWPLGVFSDLRRG